MKTILIQGAMEVEISWLREQMRETKECMEGQWNYTTGYLDKTFVVLAKTRVGVVNAAASTVLGIEKFHPDVIINQGTAGAHEESLEPGDLVLGKKILNMGGYISSKKKEGEGSSHLEWERMPLDIAGGEEKVREVTEFESDADWLELAKNVGKKWDGRVVSGVISSGDIWNKEIDYIKWLSKNHHTMAEEMEAAAAAQIAAVYKIPYLAVRVISNNEITQKDFDPSTAKKCQQFILSVIQERFKEKNI